ncbi:MAG: hypothetical protein VKK97_07605 [Synechococcaceae cyanobacterium]|nr:hypothetical protein [Synechococcaceae cyanobacterium]
MLLGALAALLASPVLAADDCQALQVQRDQLARQSVQAEVALLHRVRQRLCPVQEALATEAVSPASGQTSEPQLDYAAYIHCREQAEQDVQRSRPMLYRNLRGFTFYTGEGARLAEQADQLQRQQQDQCPARRP